MALAPGTRLGPYEILSGIGAGGMGEVYRATDVDLKRQAAIKVLPVLVAADPHRLARFQREAELLAALNHPNIAQIFGLEKSGDTIALAMELVEGPTLADAVATGSIVIAESLAIARQIAEALEAAHGQGIIHRDLKPANIKVRPDGTVKVLDFGLAKAIGTASDSNSENLANSPTLTTPIGMTQMGTLLGTAAYMAPEQARGRAVDERADIWAFGCVLFEMLAGRTPFAGDSVADILAHVIERDPDWSSLPAATPPAIRRLLRRCLEKNHKRRLAAIADALLELHDAATPTPDTGAGAPASRWQSRPIVLAAIGALATVAAVSTWGWVRAARNTSPPPLTGAYVAATLGVNVPDLAALIDRFAVSPDGTLLAVVDGARGGLLLRRTSSLELRPIAGAPPDAAAPVFSPDGQWIAFHTDSRGLMKIPTAGGEPTLLVANAGSRSDYFINLTWGSDDRIRYPSLYHDAIRSVSANGGAVETISLGPRVFVSRAVALPNGRLLVSLIRDRDSQIVVREADGTLRTLVAGWDAHLAPTGYLLFSRQEGSAWSIVSVPFDVTKATLTGETSVRAHDVPVDFATPAAVSTTGDLFYVANPPRSDRRVVIKDRAGTEREVGVPGTWVWQSVSPDGSRLALSRWEGARRTIWTLTPETGALTQVTYLDDTFNPSWMPDGKRLVFTLFPIGTGIGATSLWSVLTDGRGSVQPIRAQWDAYPGGVSADGRTLYYSANQSDQSQEDIVSVVLDGDAPKPIVLLATPADERLPRPSPDGRWLAYETNASGRAETRIAPLADLSASVQVSARGGSPIRWSRDSSKFYYTDGDEISVVDITQRGPVLTSRRAVFSMPNDWRGRVDVMPDGEHAVMIRGGLIYSDIVVLQGALPRRGGT
jgi:Tol biopolymer transport system component